MNNQALSSKLLKCQYLCGIINKNKSSLYPQFIAYGHLLVNKYQQPGNSLLQQLMVYFKHFVRSGS